MNTIARLTVTGFAAAAVMGVVSPTVAWKQDKLVITFWCPPPATDANLSAVAAEGYNLTWAPADALDTVHKHGLKALLQDPLINPSSLDNPEQTQMLRALIDRVKDHPAIEGYYVTDEPGSGAFSGLGRLVRFIREHDPKHLSYINLFPTYATKEQLGVSADAVERAKVGIPTNFAGSGTNAETIAAYREYLNNFISIVKPELISYDHYHFLKDGDGSQYFLNLELIREAALKAKLPFLNIIQACTIEPSWRQVNRNELRFLVYTTLAYGGKGISYFLYWGPKSYGGLYQDGLRTELALDAAEINRELRQIGPILLNMQSRAVYHSKPLPIDTRAIPARSAIRVFGDGQYVLGLFGDGRKTTALMIVNRDYRKPSTALVQLANPNAIIEEFDRHTGEWIGYPVDRITGKILVSLAPGDGRLFRISPVY